jgi:hypothetical protein
MIAFAHKAANILNLAASRFFWRHFSGDVNGI